MSNFKLSDEARKAKNEYLRQWRKNNPKKVKQAIVRYWEKKALEQLSESTPEQTVLKLHKQMFSLRQIAEKTGISHTQVSRIISKCNSVT